MAKLLTKMSVQPVAQGGIDAKMGEKKMEMRKQTPVVMAVRPVRPPSAMPAPDSMNAVTGDVPSREPIEIMIASVQYATVDRGNEPVFSSTTPEKRAMAVIVSLEQRRNGSTRLWTTRYRLTESTHSTMFQCSRECRRRGM